MFDDFAGVWTPVLACSELPRDRPVGVMVAGVPIVLFRDEHARVAGLLDACPHRSVKLSLGDLRDGHLRCPFHGWAFDGRGANVHVPWNPDARRARLCATAFPVRELAGQIWLFTGKHATSEPSVHEVFLGGDVRLCGFSLDVATHWTRAMENMLDWPHLPFVHRSSIGKDMRAAVTHGRMDIELETTPWGFASRIAIDGDTQAGSLDYRFPNMMNLFIPVPKKTLVMQVACVPIDQERTRLVMVTARNFAKHPWLDGMFNRENRKVALEDRVVVESAPLEVPRAVEELSVRTDAPTLHFRRRYFAELRGSSAEDAQLVELGRTPSARA